MSPTGPERPTTEAGRRLASIPFLDGDDEPIDLTDDILAIEAEARADSQREAAALDMALLVEAGFLDAYLNIHGVEDEAEARRMLERAAAEYHRLAAPAEDGHQ